MRRALPDACTATELWTPLVGQMTCHDKHPHVLAVAVGTRATHLVTTNIRDFPVPSRPAEVALVKPDRFLGDRLAATPELVASAVEGMPVRLRNQPQSPVEIARLRQGAFVAVGVAVDAHVGGAACSGAFHDPRHRPEISRELSCGPVVGRAGMDALGRRWTIAAPKCASDLCVHPNRERGARVESGRRCNSQPRGHLTSTGAQMPPRHGLRSNNATEPFDTPDFRRGRSCRTCRSTFRVERAQTSRGIRQVAFLRAKQSQSKRRWIHSSDGLKRHVTPAAAHAVE
ncbi:MAG: hypothetical protein JWO11_4271 [Nocardioides sp.]|nr:hypothetical protein [Nocardioides sp.]